MFVIMLKYICTYYRHINNHFNRIKKLRENECDEDDPISIITMMMMDTPSYPPPMSTMMVALSILYNNVLVF